MENAEKNINHISSEADNGKPKLREYKTVCAKLGLSMCIYFICRLLGSLLAPLLRDLPLGINPSLMSVLQYFAVIVFAYIIPLYLTVVIFKYKPHMGTLYKKPRRVARALGTFPAAYGLGYGIALLTLLISFVLSRVLGGETHIEELLSPTTIQPASGIAEIIMMIILLVVVAPILEEYWCRGIMYDALQPYGTGIAILISSLIFGLMHGSLYMLFYTTALGLALGYIRYATGSLFAVTILHAIINSIAATLLLLQSLVNLSDGENRVLNTVNMIFMVFVLVLIVTGIAVFFAKIPAIRKYRFENHWDVISPWKKVGFFLVSIPVIAMMVLAFNEISGQLLVNAILGVRG